MLFRLTISLALPLLLPYVVLLSHLVYKSPKDLSITKLLSYRTLALLKCAGLPPSRTLTLLRSYHFLLSRHRNFRLVLNIFSSIILILLSLVFVAVVYVFEYLYHLEHGRMTTTQSSIEFTVKSFTDNRCHVSLQRHISRQYYFVLFQASRFIPLLPQSEPAMIQYCNTLTCS